MDNRKPILRAAFEGELVVDNFAGGGGASTGIEAALGRPVDIAVNHSKEAIAMHKANHPDTKHFCEDIWEVDPREACNGRSVGLAWFSPDCTHHSRAKGGKPRSNKIRGLAWVVVRWAETVKPRVIMLENVEEFASWGPLDENGIPIKDRAGETFETFLGRLSDLGYKIDVRTLVAADYGTPTTRRRLFIVARRDGVAAWPEPSHGEGRGAKWRTAAEIIDWGIPCPSIFERKRPLAEKTLRRIAAGIKRFVVDAQEPFIVPVTHGGGFNRGRGVQMPLPTVTGANRGELALVSPTLIQTGYGERKGQKPRVPGLHIPLGTVVAGGSKHALIATFLSRYFGHGIGRGVDSPVPTITAGGQGKTALVSAFITKYYGTTTGSPMTDPVHTVTGQGNHLAKVVAFLIKYHGGVDAKALRAGALEHPIATVDTSNRFGLVTVHGIPYQIVDIGMRMLQPHELFAAQGFPEHYIIDPWFRGKPMTKTAQISLAGNAVCPQVAEAIVRSNAA